MKKKVMVVVLTMGDVHHVLAQRLSEMVGESKDKYDITIIYSGVINVSDNRNGIAKRFLESDNDYLLMIDSDNPPIKNPLELIELDLDVVACPTPMFKDLQLSINCFDCLPEGGYRSRVYDGEDLFECDRVGTGCIMIARRVLEEMESPFRTQVDDNGVHVEGEDFTFSKRAKEAGFRIYGHWNYLCNHYKTVNLLDILKLLKSKKIS